MLFAAGRQRTEVKQYNMEEKTSDTLSVSTGRADRQVASAHRRCWSLIPAPFIASYLLLIPAYAAGQSRQLTDLGIAQGRGLNNVGQAILSTGLYANGTVTPIPGLPTGTTASSGVAINDAGDVVGTANLPDGTYYGVLYSQGVLTNLGAGVEPHGINNFGAITGRVLLSGSQPYLGFVYQNGQLEQLGASLTLDGKTVYSTSGMAINSWRSIVSVRSE